MSKNSLYSRALEIYSEKGLQKLLFRTSSYLRYKFGSKYQKIIESVIPSWAKKTKIIELNGVNVPIDVSLFYNILPYYRPSHPIEDQLDYEYTEVEAIRKYSKNCNDVVIIGGGLGVTAVVAAKETGGNVTVYEQSKYIYDILKKTIKINECGDQITVINRAVAETAGSNLTHNSPSNNKYISPTELPDADMYELDCEGAETKILSQMTTRPRIILVETHENHDYVEDILIEMGYKIVEIIDNGKNQHDGCTHIRAELQN